MKIRSIKGLYKDYKRLYDWHNTISGRCKLKEMRYQVKRYNKWKFSVIRTFSYVNNIEYLEQWINHKIAMLSAATTLLNHIIGAALAFICVDSLIDFLKSINTVNLNVSLIIAKTIIALAVLTVILYFIIFIANKHSDFYKELLYILQDLK